MPKMMTGEFAQRTFYIPWTTDKSEGVWARPLTLTRRAELRREAQLEAGMDEDLATSNFCRLMLTESIEDWQGFRNAAGEDIPHSREAVAALCEYDPVLAAEMLARISAMAREGELAERKN